MMSFNGSTDLHVQSNLTFSYSNRLRMDWSKLLALADHESQVDTSMNDKVHRIFRTDSPWRCTLQSNRISFVSMIDTFTYECCTNAADQTKKIVHKFLNSNDRHLSLKQLNNWNCYHNVSFQWLLYVEWEDRSVWWEDHHSSIAMNSNGNSWKKLYYLESCLIVVASMEIQSVSVHNLE